MSWKEDILWAFCEAGKIIRNDSDMDDKTLRLLCTSIIAAGIRANYVTMHAAREAAEDEEMDIQDIVANWASSQFDFVEKHADTNG
jgi:hypothetical protein